jgi:hypothetical protein
VPLDIRTVVLQEVLTCLSDRAPLMAKADTEGGTDYLYMMSSEYKMHSLDIMNIAV